MLMALGLKKLLSPDLRTEKTVFYNIWYLFTAIVVIFCFSQIPEGISIYGHMNFLMHFLGGGFTVTLIYEYLKGFVKWKPPLLSDLTILYFVLSGFTVASELLEFLLDTITRRWYSQTRIDTWLDLLANILGAITLWVIIKTANKTYSLYRLKKDK